MLKPDRFSCFQKIQLEQDPPVIQEVEKWEDKHMQQNNGKRAKET